MIIMVHYAILKQLQDNLPSCYQSSLLHVLPDFATKLRLSKIVLAKTDSLEDLLQSDSQAVQLSAYCKTLFGKFISKDLSLGPSLSKKLFMQMETSCV